MNIDLNRPALARFARHHAGVAVLALLIPVVLLPVSVLAPLVALATVVVGTVELARWARADRFSVHATRLDGSHDRLDEEPVGALR